MKEHHLFEHYNLITVGFPKTHNKIEGVYRINTQYVGASIHIRQRIIKYLTAFERNDYNKIPKRVLKILKSGMPIYVFMESTNPLNEEKISKKYKVNTPKEQFYHIQYKYQYKRKAS